MILRTRNCSNMIGRFRERRYQLTAARRNEATIKFDHNLETARYFERECSKARQFDSWSTSRHSNNLKKSIKAECLNSRRSRLKDLLEKEQESYARECEASLRRKKSVKNVQNYNPLLRLEKKAEDSLYRPLNCRRIQSYFCGPYLTGQDYVRPILKDLNERSNVLDQKAPTRLSMDRTNLRPEIHESSEHGGKHEKILSHDNTVWGQENYNERMDVYKENSRSARASSIYGGEGDSSETRKESQRSQLPNACCIEMSEHRPRSRRLHDSHFHLGDNEDSPSRDAEHEKANEKYRQYRYGNKSLEDTNVEEQQKENESAENGGAQVENEENGKIEGDKEEDHEQRDETDRVYEQEQELVEESEHEEKHQVSFNSPVIEVTEEQRTLNDIQDKTDQRDIDREIDAKASAGKWDHRHFETEKSMPWLRMIPGDKNLSEQMFLYLTHNELKERIQNLENRENQACSKHQWDEALRLRDMKNRLDLAREKNLYRREDLQLDPEVKKRGMASIEARQRLLKERENVCTNSSMYSEEAKEIWDKWVAEDKNSILVDACLQREVLMKELEENWRSLAIDDKQKISDSYKDKNLINLELKNAQIDNLSVFTPAKR